MATKTIVQFADWDKHSGMCKMVMERGGREVAARWLCLGNRTMQDARLIAHAMGWLKYEHSAMWFGPTIEEAIQAIEWVLEWDGQKQASHRIDRHEPTAGHHIGMQVGHQDVQYWRHFESVGSNSDACQKGCRHHSPSSLGCVHAGSTRS